MELLKYIEEENTVKVVEYLSAYDDEEMDIIDDLLSILIKCSNTEILIVLLKFIDNTGYFDDYEPVDGEPLIDCIDKNNFERLQIMMDHLYKNQGLFDPCPLQYAISRGELEAVKILEKGGVVMVCGDGGHSEFFEAIASGNLEIVKYYCEEVMERHGGFDLEDKEWSKIALEYGHEHIIEYICK